MNIMSREHQERAVPGRSGLRALAAIAAIAAAALVTSASAADARGFGDGIGRGNAHVGGFRTSFRHSGLRFRHRRNWQRNWHVRWYRPWIYGVGKSAAPVRGAQAVQQGQAKSAEPVPTR
jgi:hypothetical protein